MFKNREQAAQLLAKKLLKYKREDVLVFAIPRGAVIMGKIITKALSARLDVIVVKKLGAPNNPELAIGAVGPEAVVYWDTALCRALHVSKKEKNQELRIKNHEREEREKMFRHNRPYPNMQKKTVIVIDDGVATGATAIATGMFLQKRKISKSILATAVIAKDTLIKVKRYFDDVIYLEASGEFGAVGQFYEEFEQVSDEKVKRML